LGSKEALGIHCAISIVIYLSINGDTEFTGSRLETMLSEIRTNFESSSEFRDVDRIPVLVKICFAIDFKSQDCKRKLR